MGRHCAICFAATAAAWFIAPAGIAGLSSGMISASAFRTYHTPLNSQPDFINALKAARQFAESVSQELGMQVGANGLQGVCLWHYALQTCVSYVCPPENAWFAHEFGFAAGRITPISSQPDCYQHAQLSLPVR
jgi:hypothetical protein